MITLKGLYKTGPVLLLAVFLGACSPRNDSELKEQKTKAGPTILPDMVGAVRQKVIASTATKPASINLKSKRINDQVYKQYLQQVSPFKFEAFPVKDHYFGRAAPLDLVSHEDARYYRKTLTRGLEIGSNFAGKYTLVNIECGPTCHDIFIIDTQTGKILDKVSGALGVNYRADSRLLILNPPEPTVDYKSCPNCEPVVYVMEKGLLYKAKIMK